MNVAASPGAHICASAQIYPDRKPAEVPPRPAWTGVDTRVAGASTHIEPAEEELKESNKDQRHAFTVYTALFQVDPTLLR